jgi:hypothetical protein
VDSADIYRATDADFGGASEEDKTRLAEKLANDFKGALTKHKYPITGQSAQGVVRLHLILAGIKESKPVAATALRLTPLGLGMSAAKSVSGHNSALVGSVTVSGELIDAETGEAIDGPPSSASSAGRKSSPRPSIASCTARRDDAQQRSRRRRHSLLRGGRHERRAARRCQLGCVLTQARRGATTAELHSGTELVEVTAALGSQRHRLFPR